MLAFFHSLGKHSLSRQFLKRIASGFAIEEAHMLLALISVAEVVALISAVEVVLLLVICMLRYVSQIK